METVSIIQLVIAAYLAFLGTFISTKNVQSALIFKTIPTISAFLLGLIAFKVI